MTDSSKNFMRTEMKEYAAAPKSSIRIQLSYHYIQKKSSIYINHIVGSSVCLSVCVSVCLSALNLRSLKSHDHETWHVGLLSDVDVHGLSGILIFGRVTPQAHAA